MELSTQNMELSTQNMELSTQNMELSTQHEDTRQALIRQNLDYQADNETLRRKLQETCNSLSRAENELLAIYNSKSWKLAMVLRRLRSLAKLREI
jgi:hypothetical protein